MNGLSCFEMATNKTDALLDVEVNNNNSRSGSNGIDNNKRENEKNLKQTSK